MRLRRTIVALAAFAVLVPASQALAAPAHDDFADAAGAAPLPFDLHVNTAGATDEPFEETLESGGGDWCKANPGIWVRFTPEETTTVIAVIDGPQQAAAALFEGTDESSLSFIYCMRSLDGREGSSDGNLHTLEAGHTYYVRLSTAEDGPAEGSYDFTLAVASGITGVIKNQHGDPLDGTLVWAYDGAKRRIAAACSHDGGQYRVSGLPADTYRLRYERGACGGSGTDDAQTEWYEDAGSFADATPVVVKASGDTTGIVVAMGEKPEPTPTETETPTPTDTPTRAPTDRPDPSDVPTEPGETTTETPDETDTPAAVGTLGPADGGGSPWVVALFVLVLLVPASAGGVYLARRRADRAQD